MNRNSVITVLFSAMALFGVLRCSRQAHVVWQQQFSSGLGDAAVSVAVDGNDLIVGATCQDPAATGKTVWELLRYDPSGKLLWHQSYSRGACDSLAAIAVAPNHDIFAVGWTSSDDSPDSVRLLLGCFTAQGASRWQKEYALGFTTLGAALSLDSLGQITVCGSVTHRDSSRTSDILVAQFDTAGSLFRHEALDFGGNEYGEDMVRFRGRPSTITIVAGKRIPLAGATDSLRDRDIVIAGYGPEHNELWRELYASGGKEAVVRLAGLSATVSSRTGIHVLPLVSRWGNWEILQDTRYPGDSNSTCLGLTADQGGHVLGVGSAGPDGHRRFLGWHYFRGKFFNFLPAEGYVPGTDDRASAIALDAVGSAIVVGTFGTGKDAGVLTLKVALPRYKPPPYLPYGYGYGGR